MGWKLYMWKKDGEIVFVGVYDSKEECSAISIEAKKRAGYDIYFTWVPYGVYKE